MIQKIVKKHSLHDFSETEEDLKYWLSKTPEERLAAVEYLRRQYYGSASGFQRIARIVKRSRG
jgi:hypothetical protein